MLTQSPSSPSTPASVLNVVFVGRTSLLVNCILSLEATARRHQISLNIKAIVSPDPIIQEWAKSQDLQLLTFAQFTHRMQNGWKETANNKSCSNHTRADNVDHTDVDVTICDDHSIDYIFSIYNHWLFDSRHLNSRFLAREILNIHDGPLPRYAGTNAISWSIANGETEHGCTWHHMELTVDTGAIVAQELVKISNQETTSSLRFKILSAASESFQRVADLIAQSRFHQPIANLPSVSQDPSLFLYHSRLNVLPAGGIIPLFSPPTSSLGRRYPMSVSHGQILNHLVRAANFGPDTNNWGQPKLVFRIAHPQPIAQHSASFLSSHSSHGVDRLVLIAVHGAEPLPVLSLDSTESDALDSRTVTLPRMLNSSSGIVRELKLRLSNTHRPIDSTSIIIQLLNGEYVHFYDLSLLHSAGGSSSLTAEQVQSLHDCVNLDPFHNIGSSSLCRPLSQIEIEWIDRAVKLLVESESRWIKNLLAMHKDREVWMKHASNTSRSAQVHVLPIQSPTNSRTTRKVANEFYKSPMKLLDYPILKDINQRIRQIKEKKNEMSAALSSNLNSFLLSSTDECVLQAAILVALQLHPPSFSSSNHTILGPLTKTAMERLNFEQLFTRFEGGDSNTNSPLSQSPADTRNCHPAKNCFDFASTLISFFTPISLSSNWRRRNDSVGKTTGDTPPVSGSVGDFPLNIGDIWTLVGALSSSSKLSVTPAFVHHEVIQPSPSLPFLVDLFDRHPALRDSFDLLTLVGVWFTPTLASVTNINGNGKESDCINKDDVQVEDSKTNTHFESLPVSAAIDAFPGSLLFLHSPATSQWELHSRLVLDHSLSSEVLDFLGHIDLVLRYLLDEESSLSESGQPNSNITKTAVTEPNITPTKGDQSTEQQDIQSQSTIGNISAANVGQMFLIQNDQHPSDVAVIDCEGVYFTYSDLFLRANRLAHYTYSSYEHIRPGSTIVQICDRSFEMIIGQIAIQLLGCTYGSIGVHEPFIRAIEMINDMQPGIIFVQQKHVQLVQSLLQQRDVSIRQTASTHTALPYLVIDSSLVISEHQVPVDWPTPCSSIPSLTLSNPTAYIIFTSGSTGKPKGARLSQKNLLSYIHNSSSTPIGHAPKQMWLAHSPTSFDAHILDHLIPLFTGGSIVLVSELRKLDLSYVTQLVSSHQVSDLVSPPSFLGTLAEHLDLTNSWSQVASLRVIRCGGEAMPTSLVRQWHRGIKKILPPLTAPSIPFLFNAYGPSECTIISTFYPLTEADETSNEIPIGWPIPSFDVFVMDENNRVVDDDQVGMLFIGGPCTFQGYLNKPDATKNALIHVSDHLSLSSSHGLFYRTGDLVRRDSRGCLWFCGRRDFQVKLRGQRLELGEIEIVISELQQVDRVILMKTVWQGEDYLVAYVQPAVGILDEKDTSPRGAASPTYSHLRATIIRHCSTRLASYMCPTFILFLSSFPLTANGKVDRSRLPAPDRQHLMLHPQTTSSNIILPVDQDQQIPASVSMPIDTSASMATSILSSATNYPQTTPVSFLSIVSHVWETIFPEIPRPLDEHADFYQLGGTSLLLIRYLSMLQAQLQTWIKDTVKGAHLQFHIGIHHVFEHRTIATMAACLQHEYGLLNSFTPRNSRSGSLSKAVDIAQQCQFTFSPTSGRTTPFPPTSGRATPFPPLSGRTTPFLPTSGRTTPQSTGVVPSSNHLDPMRINSAISSSSSSHVPSSAPSLPSLSVLASSPSSACKSNPSSSTAKSVAVVGMAGRFPNADSIDDLWDNLVRNVDCIRHYTTDQLAEAGVPVESLYHGNYVRSYGRFGREGTGDPYAFDYSFFGYTAAEASLIDPQHRYFLQVCYEALMDAGIQPTLTSSLPTKQQRKIGVFAGVGEMKQLEANQPNRSQPLDSINNSSSANSPSIRPVSQAEQFAKMLGSSKDFLCTRVAHRLGLIGPCVSVQTACSTSLVAVHMACQSIIDGDSAIALAGGISLRELGDCGYEFEPGMILSPDGHCRPFDLNCNGTVPGQGAGVVVLKLLDDAIRDGDHVYGVILGSAINNDGNNKPSFAAPSVEGQVACITAALKKSQVDPATIGLLEAHGTGTPVGDAVELQAVTQVYRSFTSAEQFCVLGSGKSQLGHLDAAAGVTGLIKALLCLDRRMLLPIKQFDPQPAHVDLSSSPFRILHTAIPWNLPATSGSPPSPIGDTNGEVDTISNSDMISRVAVRRAAVTSLGMGSTNCHVILEEFVPSSTSSPLPSSTSSPLPSSSSLSSPLSSRKVNQHQVIYSREVISPHIISLCAHTDTVLIQMIRDLLDHLQHQLHSFQASNSPHPMGTQQEENAWLERLAFSYNKSSEGLFFLWRRSWVVENISQLISALEEEINTTQKSGPPITPSSSSNHSRTASMMLGVEVGQLQRIIFSFPGQGSQYTGIGLHAYHHIPLFRYHLLSAFNTLVDVTSGWTGLHLLQVDTANGREWRLSKSLHQFCVQLANDAQVNRQSTLLNLLSHSQLSGKGPSASLIAHVVLFLVQHSFALTLIDLGVSPLALIGHSLGQYVAATVCGVWSLSQAMAVILWRGARMDETPPGSMVACRASKGQCQQIIQQLKGTSTHSQLKQLSIAAVNSSSHVVVTGDSGDVDQFIQLMSQTYPLVISKKLHVSHAFHSALMDSMVAEFACFLDQFPCQSPMRPLICAINGELILNAPSTNYWCQHLRESVEFNLAIRSAIEHVSSSSGFVLNLSSSDVCIIEIGSGQATKTFVLASSTLVQDQQHAHHPDLSSQSVAHSEELSTAAVPTVMRRCWNDSLVGSGSDKATVPVIHFFSVLPSFVEYTSKLTNDGLVFSRAVSQLWQQGAIMDWSHWYDPYRSAPIAKVPLPRFKFAPTRLLPTKAIGYSGRTSSRRHSSINFSTPFVQDQQQPSSLSSSADDPPMSSNSSVSGHGTPTHNELSNTPTRNEYRRIGCRSPMQNNAPRNLAIPTKQRQLGITTTPHLSATTNPNQTPKSSKHSTSLTIDSLHGDLCHCILQSFIYSLSQHDLRSDDDFFVAGGDSLQAISALTQARKLVTELLRPHINELGSHRVQHCLSLLSTRALLKERTPTKLANMIVEGFRKVLEASDPYLCPQSVETVVSIGQQRDLTQLQQHDHNIVSAYSPSSHLMTHRSLITSPMTLNFNRTRALSNPSPDANPDIVSKCESPRPMMNLTLNSDLVKNLFSSPRSVTQPPASTECFALELITCDRCSDCVVLLNSVDGSINSPDSCSSALTPPSGSSYSPGTSSYLSSSISVDSELVRPISSTSPASTPALFLVHAVGGDVMSFAPLVSLLSHSCISTVYAFRARSLDPSNTEIEVHSVDNRSHTHSHAPINELREMAAFYLTLLLQQLCHDAFVANGGSISSSSLVVPLAPFVLGGHSFGGTVAFEMARLFEEMTVHRTQGQAFLRWKSIDTGNQLDNQRLMNEDELSWLSTTTFLLPARPRLILLDSPILGALPDPSILSHPCDQLYYICGSATGISPDEWSRICDAHDHDIGRLLLFVSVYTKKRVSITRGMLDTWQSHLHALYSYQPTISTMQIADMANNKYHYLGSFAVELKRLTNYQSHSAATSISDLYSSHFQSKQTRPARSSYSSSALIFRPLIGSTLVPLTFHLPWHELLSGDLQVVRVEGDHLTMMTIAKERIARKISAFLDASNI